MRLAIQIFRKDAERLWPAILLTLVLLSYWTFRDATLVSISDADNWMNLALPFAWAVLIALVVHEDSLVGDRQFWPALPCGWKPLLAAKTAFIALFIHLPYFVATVIVLASRGFHPASHVPHLFWKQLVLLSLTIPAFGAATLVKNVAHFLLLSIVIASAVVLRVRQFDVPEWQVWTWDIRWHLALVVLVAGSLVLASLQFIRRCTHVSRALGVLLVLTVTGLYVWIPRDTVARLATVFSPAPESRKQTNIRLLEPEPAGSVPFWPGAGMTTVGLPLMLDGALGNERDADPVSLEITAADGTHYDVTPSRNMNPSSGDRVAATVIPTGPGGRFRLALYFYSASAWAGARSGRVTVRGRMLIRYAEPGPSVALASGRVADMGETGRCYMAAAGRHDFIECDSPEIGGRDIGLKMRGGMTGVRFSEQQNGRPSRFPQNRWLSPLHRSSALSGVDDSFAVVPHTPLGLRILEYTISNIDLNDFVARPRASQGAGR